MARFFNPDQISEEGKLHAPAAERNKDAILEVLLDHLPSAGTVLEIASGTGQHAVHFAPRLSHLHWQPTDLDPRHIASIEAWRAEAGAENLLAPRALNVLEPWPVHDLPAPVTAITANNLIHIAPWAVAEALIAGAADLLGGGGVLFLYGPYRRGGAHTAPSNEAFDAHLKSHDPAWGLRDMEAVTDLATEAGFGTPTIVEMPTNNFSLIFRK
ncbi:DUF938 domain-containing protein [Kordiimonas marina]|uniref:DUF938 domain-containing protein n=1 Tax=Kordiimonas marina TaxID=2872312 RepID=UPI001FF14159|nr:DUF938 domain-containing protein [Kordiimonas marina]MCJ9429791.1 DUF938 domain-containing protein [Kordiimonas marina]